MKRIWDICVVDSEGNYVLDECEWHWVEDDAPLVQCLGGGGSSPAPAPAQTTTTVEKQDPWEGQQPFLKKGFSEAERIYDDLKPEYFPNSTLADISPETNVALDLRTQRALAGSPVMNAAQQQLTDTLGGSYLSGNPYIDATYDRASGKVKEAVNSQFAKAGRQGS